MQNKKRGQVTIFVIIAIVIVIGIAAYFILTKQEKATTLDPVENPVGYIEDCMKLSTQKVLPSITRSGGLLAPKKAFYFNETNVTMVCSSMGYGKLCTNRHPMISVEIENQIIKSIKPSVDSCFAKLKTSFKNYDYREIGNTSYLNIDIVSGMIIVKADKKISYTKNSQTSMINGFNSKVNSDLYDFIIIQNKILNEEVSCDCEMESCHAYQTRSEIDGSKFGVTNFVASVGNPKFGDGEEVYTIKSINTQEEFNFALRNCVRAPYGYGGAS